jgi:monooxygenase
MANEEFDVLIVGAGISGISAAVHLKKHCPDRSFAILEGRERLGGTWDLFKYPGVRSDSDMYTLGFAFKPWTHEKSIADAPSILAYLHETVREFDVEKAIQFNSSVKAISWDSGTARWTVTVEGAGGERTEKRCKFLAMCTGYYSYTAPYEPEFAGRETFQGQLFHPQFWPEALDYKGKKMVVIGSGATAVTIIPAVAADGVGHVTMLQRSPTYCISRPAKDRLANRLRKILPARFAYAITRRKNATMQQFLYNATQKSPVKAKQRLIDLVSKELPEGYDVGTNFTPRYNPWEQRLCLVPDSDLFTAISSGKADVITDEIERFTPTGIALKSGKTLDADIIVTATGLKMEIMSGVDLTVDGAPVRVGETFSYKGCMYSSVPNLTSTFGYSNASWTLKADLISAYICRLLNHMKTSGTDICVAVPKGVKEVPGGMTNLSSGYVQRAHGLVPMQGDVNPWVVHHNYTVDKKLMRYGRLDDGAMTFRKVGGEVKRTSLEQAIAAE